MADGQKTPKLRPPAQTYVSAAPEKSWSEKTLDGLEGWLPQGSEAQKALHRARNRQPVEFVGDDFDPAVHFTQHQGYAELKTEVLVDEDWWSKARLKFEYWPDVAHHPEIKMLPVASGANFQWVKDKGWLF